MGACQAIEGGKEGGTGKDSAVTQPTGADQSGTAIQGCSLGVAVGGKPVFLVVHYDGGAAAAGETPQRVDRAEGMLVLLLNLFHSRIEQPGRATMP